MSADQITEEQVKRAYLIAAKVVQLHGDKYLPIFERVCDELKKIEKKSEIKKLAFSLECDSNDTDNKGKC